ncbi:hypothetical protein ACP70R_008706 [Stipagrostis hirtigluma subsp. patula]
MGSRGGGGGGGRDRLSGLDDGVLGHILSFLPADEAARAAALSRRWRDVFAHVHTLSMEEEPGGTVVCCGPGGIDCYDCPVDDQPPPPSAFVAAVGAAILGRLCRPGGLAGAPLRALALAFLELRENDAGFLDGWLAYLLRQAGDELHVDLRLQREPMCARSHTRRRRGCTDAKDHDDGGGGGGEARGPPWRSARATREKFVYVAPARLFSCAALRTLRIGPCRLDPPAAAALPSLGTLHLTGVTGPEGAVQRLVAACPRLADLTLEGCAELTALAVLGTRLRRLALRCCHGLAAVAVDSSELRAFEYRGAAPEPAFLTMLGPRRLTSCTVDFCGEEATDTAELAKTRDFLQLFAGAHRLHLKSARLGAGAGGSPVQVFPQLANIRHLELMGILPQDDTAAAVATVTRILERTPNLETLTLIFMPEPKSPEEKAYVGCDEEFNTHRLKYNRCAALAVPDMEIPCLRETTREINFVHYQGGMAQRTLAKFLLRNAPVVDEVCGEFARGPLWIQTRLMEEIREWTMNKFANMMFF